MRPAKTIQGPPEAFSALQLRLLTGGLDASAVKHRLASDGAQIPYVEGWFVIAQANAIFGYSGWEREVVHFERVFEQRRTDEVSCGYLARVRISVNVRARKIVREGTGFGQGKGRTLAEAHELAVKSAETDATKRALSTFGNRFGLGLYGKEILATPLSIAPHDVASRNEEKGATLTLFGADGVAVDTGRSPEAFCAGLRQLIGRCDNKTSVEALFQHNESEIAKVSASGLTTLRGTLYSEILKKLFKEKKTSFINLSLGTPVSAAAADQIATHTPQTDPVTSLTLPPEGTEQSGRVPIDKHALMIGVEKRVRDKLHLQEVAQMPCVICNRQPSHPHHLKFAQHHGLSQKVSDEFVLPVCALHHGDLHRSAREEKWWQDQKVDPLPIAAELWARHCAQRQ